MIVLHPLDPVLTPVVSREVGGTDGEEEGHGSFFIGLRRAGCMADSIVVFLKTLCGGEWGWIGFGGRNGGLRGGGRSGRHAC